MGNIVLGRRNNYGYDQRVELFGEKGLLKVENNKRKDDLAEWNEGGLVQSQGKQEFMEYYQEEFKWSLYDFIGSVIEGEQGNRERQHRSTIGDAYQAFRAVRACQQSIKEGKPVNMDDIQ